VATKPQEFDEFMNNNLSRRPVKPLLVPVDAQIQMDRLESKLESMRAALDGFSGLESWQAVGPGADPDFHTSKLSQYFRALKRRKGMVVLAAFVGLIGGGLFTLSQTPIYRARTSIEIIGLNDNFLNTKEVDPVESRGYTSDSYIQTQAEILTSASLVRRAVATTPPAAAPSLPSDSGSPSRISQTLEQLGLQKAKKRGEALDETPSVVANLKVQPRRGTRLIEIEYDSENPQKAAAFANNLAKVYIDYTLETRVGASQQTASLLNRELESLERKLHEAQNALQDHAQRKHIVFTDDRATVQGEKLRELQSSLAKAQSDRISLQSKYEMASGSPPEALPEVMDSPTLREYYSKIPELQRQLAELKSIYGPDYYKIKRTEAQLATLQGLFNEERKNVLTRTRNEYETSMRRERLLTDVMATQGQVVSEQGRDVVTYDLLKGQVDTYKGLYDSMLQKAKSAGLASALRESTARVMEPAAPPAVPYKPNVPLNCAVGLLTGLLGGLGLVIAKDQANKTLKSPGDLLLYANMPELAVIPSVSADPYLRTLGSTQEWMPRMLRMEPTASGEDCNPLPARAPELAVWRHKPTLMAETFRGLLTSILFSSPDEKKLHVLVMTSPGPGEGKSTITSNLAIAMAEVRGRVLLIDADARKPRIHEIFNVPNEQGLTTYLMGRTPLDESAIGELIVASPVPGLYILPSGPQHSSVSALLHSERLTELLRFLRPRFELIVIDSPPVLHVPDARILARRADAAIVVARALKTTRDALLQAKQRFEDDGVTVLGAILNDWSPKDDPGSGYFNPAYYQNNNTKHTSS
jgi:capsular exopolysaccharide synthesis family protein